MAATDPEATFAAAALTGLLASPYGMELAVEDTALLAWQYGAAMVAYRDEHRRMAQDEHEDAERIRAADTGTSAGDRRDGRPDWARSSVDE